MPTPPPKSPIELLAAFNSDRSESAFSALVDHFNGLVYSSALRRTGDPQMAEEITQNVFAALARKAASLARHPSLTAWMFETTRFEASNAIRAARRHREKIAALAKEATTMDKQPHTPTWQDAIPLLDQSLDRLSAKDRQIVLQRFFQKQKFSQISKETGLSEAACKMRLKRALEKLTSFLTARGVTISATVIASGLATELARSAPAHLNASTLTVTQIVTMSSVKTAALVSAAIFLIASIPIVQLQSQASKLNHQLLELEQKTASRAPQSQPINILPKVPAGSRFIKKTLATSNVPLDVDAFMAALGKAAISQNQLEMLQLLVPVGHLDHEALDAFSAEVISHESHPDVKEIALEMLDIFNTLGPRDTFERMLRSERHVRDYSIQFEEWVTEDPEAAIAWYQQKLAAGELDGKGASERPEQALYTTIIQSIAATDPQRAVDLYFQGSPVQKSYQQAWSLGTTLYQQALESGDPTPFESFLSHPDNLTERDTIIAAALGALPQESRFEDSLTLIEKYTNTPEENLSAKLSAVRGDHESDFTTRADWLLANVTQEQSQSAMKSLIHSALRQLRETGLDRWIDNQPPGPLRDQALLQISNHRNEQQNFEAARSRAEEITNPDLRERTLRRIFK